MTTGKCPACGHKAHDQPCRKLGRVTCRPVATPDGTTLVRGQFPCDCTHRTVKP